MSSSRYCSTTLAEKRGQDFIRTFYAIVEGRATYITQNKQILEFKNGQIKSKRQVKRV